MRTPFVHLRRRQPDAVVLGHRVDHVVDQLLNRRALRISAFSSGRAFARSTGCPMRATFRIDMTGELYCARVMLPAPARRLARVPVLPALRRRARAAAAESRPSPSGPVCTRCGFVFYLDPKIAVGTIIATQSGPARARPPRDRAGLRQVGVSGRLRRSRRTADRRRRSAKRARNAASTCASTALVNIYSYAGPRAGHRRLRGDGDRRAAVRGRGVSRDERSSRRSAIPWDGSRSAARRRAARLPGRPAPPDPQLALPSVCTLLHVRRRVR